MSSRDQPEDRPSGPARTDGPEEAPDAPRSSSRDVILRTARRLFAERGYSAVSIRDIASQAGVSPALVIKHGGSKGEIFRSAIDFEPTTVLLDAPTEELGERIVRRIVDAHRSGRPAPLTRAVVLVLPAPDPDDLRARFDAAYLEPLTARLGGTPDARRRAEMIVAAATGLSVSVRCFHHHADPDHDEELVARYGRLVQDLVDG